jgi:O-antigen/teichoic acid export membrane protein
VSNTAVQDTESVFSRSTATVRLVLGSLRLKAGGTSTAEGRSQERYRRIALTTLTSASAKAITLLTMIVSVPLTVHYLGTERYALWMVISSSVAMLTFSDLGIGNGLLTAIAESHGKGDERAARQYVSSAFFMLSGISSVVLIALWFGYSAVPWSRIFSVHSASAMAEAGPAAAVFIACFAIGLPLGIVQRIESGYQDGFTNNLWTMLGSLLGLGGLLLAVRLRAGLPWLVFSITGAPLIATSMNGAFLFSVRRRELFPRWSRSSGTHMKQLLHYGVYFFILQTCVATAANADNLITAHLLGAGAVTTYAVTMRMFTVIPGVLLMVLFPLWPAYGESIARGEICWARRALVRSLKLILAVTSIAGVALVLLGPWILHLWVGKSFSTSRPLLVAMAVWVALTTGANAISIFLNGAKKMRVQIVSAVCMCVFSLLLKILLAPRFGLVAIVWSTNIAYALFIWLPAAMYLPRMLFAMQSEADARLEDNLSSVLVNQNSGAM